MGAIPGERRVCTSGERPHLSAAAPQVKHLDQVMGQEMDQVMGQEMAQVMDQEMDQVMEVVKLER